MTLKDRGKNCHLLRVIIGHLLHVIYRSYKPLAVCTINYARSANVARSANDARRAIMTAKGVMPPEGQITRVALITPKA